MKGVLILSCFIVLSRGQAEPPCCGPDKQWEADEGLMIGANTGGVGSITMGMLKLSRDDDIQMENTEGDVWTNGQKSHVRNLQDFNKKIQYSVVDGNCTVTTLQYEYIRSCIPVGSQKVQSTHYGLPSNPINVDMYMTKLLGLNMIISALPLGDPSEKKCMPMGEVFYGGGHSSGTMMNFGFTNYTSGIRDRSVFDKPPQCTQGPVIKTHTRSMGRYPRHLFE